MAALARRLLSLLSARHTVQVVRSIFVDVNPDVVGAFLADVEHLPAIETKLDRVVVSGRDALGRPTRMRARARFGPFRYWFEIGLRVRSNGGFKSQVCESPWAAFSGGFSVRRSGSGCTVTHVERYDLKHGIASRWFGPAWRAYIAHSMDVELARLKSLFNSSSKSSFDPRPA